MWCGLIVVKVFCWLWMYQVPTAVSVMRMSIKAYIRSVWCLQLPLTWGWSGRLLFERCEICKVFLAKAFNPEAQLIAALTWMEQYIFLFKAMLITRAHWMQCNRCRAFVMCCDHICMFVIYIYHLHSEVKQVFVTAHFSEQNQYPKI